MGSIILISLFAALVYFFIRKMMAAKLRDNLGKKNFSKAWQDAIDKNVPLYQKLSADLRKELHGHIQIFMAEKKFEGCNGLVITEEMKVTIAAQACVLLLNRKANYFPKLLTILVYPHAYVGTEIVRVAQNVYREKKIVRLGESWNSGELVLAWDHVSQTVSDQHDGHNLVFHEFAHQLDQEDGRADGVPILQRKSCYAPWVRVLGAEYDQLRKDVKADRPSLLRDYGATNPAEFFAVATEVFFELPKQLENKEPELYDQLKDYYQLDPAQW